MLSVKTIDKGKILFFITSLLFIAINSVLIANEFYYFSLVPVLLIFLWMAFFFIDRFTLLIIFFVPLSVQLTRIMGKTDSDIYLPTEPMLAMVVILFFLNYLKGQRLDSRILKHPLSIAIYIHIAWILITSITSSMPVISFKFLLSRLWFVIPFYFVAAGMFRSGKRVKQYIWLYIIPFSLVIIYVNYKLATHGMNNQQAANFVVDPFFNDHTSYGAIIAMLLPVIAGFLFTARNRSKYVKLLIFMLLVFYAVALIFSYTRAAWLSVIIASGVWIIIKLKIKWQFLLAGAGIIVALIFNYRTEILIKARQNKQDSSGNFSEHLQSVINIRNDVSNLERLNRWNCAVRMFREKPVLGWGPGTYMFQYAPFQISNEKTEISTNAGVKGNAHSEYLGPLSEQGFIGLLSIISIVIITILTALRVYFGSTKRKVRILILSVLLGLITYYVHGIMNNFLDTDKASALFWGYSAIIVAYDIRRKTPS